jgi:hypothetical protein
MEIMRLSVAEGLAASHRLGAKSEKLQSRDVTATENVRFLYDLSRLQIEM